MYFLSFIWNPNETLFKIGFLQIKYYNLLWIVAFALGWYIMKRIYNNENKTVEQLDSLFINAVLATMLGARLGHVFFMIGLITKTILQKFFYPFGRVPVIHFSEL